MNAKLDSKKFLKAVGNKFESLRKEQKKECEAVAKIIKITPALLISIERGEHDLYLDLLFELCDVYEISPYDFFEEVSNALRG